jgi:arylsulfatase A-like enzyme
VLLLLAAAARYALHLWARRHGEEAARAAPAWPSDSPSVILVLLDTLRADRVGCYGYTRATTPGLDALIPEAVLFENAYSQAPNTPPSIASILTSLYPSSHHFTGSNRLNEGAITLAESFAAAGYRTGGFVDSGYLRARFGMGQGFQTYDDAGGGFAAILPKAAAWARAEPGRPFFLLVHTYDIHTPYEETPAPYRDAFVQGTTASDLTSEDLEEIRTGKLKRTLTPEETRHFSDLYDGGILHADSLLATFLGDLRGERLLDDAVLAITSDHGEEFMEHGSVLHEKLYRTVTHVPWLLRLPHGEHGSLRVPEIVETIDLAPTLLAAAGVPAHAGMQGRNLLPRLAGGPLAEPQAMSQVTWDAEELGYYRGDEHLLLKPSAGRIELYDVRQDPLEQSNLAAGNPEALGALGAALTSRLEGANRRTYLRRGAEARALLDPETEKSLRALGYVQ